MTIKDAGMRIRVEKDLRKSFAEACHSEGRRASDVLRDFMRQFVARASGGRQASLFAANERSGGSGAGRNKDAEHNPPASS